MIIDEKSTKDEVLAAVRQNGKALQYASPQLQDDYDIVFAALMQDPWALRYASPRLQDNNYLVRLAMFCCPDALFCASKRLIDYFYDADYEYDKEDFIADYCDPDNFDSVLFFIRHGMSIEYFDNLNERFLDEPEIILAAVQQNPYELQFASERLLDDPEIVAAAVKNDGWALHFASERLQKIGINGIRKLAEEQKQKREISNARIDIKNKRLITNQKTL